MYDKIKILAPSDKMLLENRLTCLYGVPQVRYVKGRKYKTIENDRRVKKFQLEYFNGAYLV
jgi:hypothetical protein